MLYKNNANKIIVYKENIIILWNITETNVCFLTSDLCTIALGQTITLIKTICLQQYVQDVRHFPSDLG